MKEKEFNKLWDECCDYEAEEGSAITVDEGMSMNLTNAIIEAEKEEKCLALTDWTEVDF